MAIGQVIGTRQVEDMPLNGRNFQQLASIVPRAIPTYGARDTGQGGVSFSGTRSFDNSFLLDGANNSTNTAEMATRVNVDNSSDANLGSAHAGDTFHDPRHLNWEYGNSDFDVRHRFVFSGIYDLPFGRGRRYGSEWNAVTNGVLGGWQLNGIWSAQTGYWFTPFGVNDSCYCNDGNASSLRPDAVAGQDTNSGPKTPAQWFNLNAFDVNVPMAVTAMPGVIRSSVRVCRTSISGFIRTFR